MRGRIATAVTLATLVVGAAAGYAMPTRPATAAGIGRDGVTHRSVVRIAKWRVEPAAAQASGGLWSVSCPSLAVCIAVGGQNQPLVERWNRTRWSVQRTPAIPGASGGLKGVSCSSRTACVAVGFITRGSGQQAIVFALAERWNGTRWSIQRISQRAGLGVELSGVSCVSAGWCTAVGTGTASWTVAEHWNGREWSIQRTPTVERGELSSISCISRSFCTAVGDIAPVPFGFSSAADNENPLAPAPIAERWNGRVWSIERTPRTSGYQAALTGVSCLAGNACIAVGWWASSTGHDLVERWNGKRWSIVANRTPAGAVFVGLSGVSCASIVACMAVGFNTAYDGSTQMFAERWNRHNWSLQPIRTPAGTSGNQLVAVSCTAATRCTAVGDTPPGRTLVEGYS